MWFWFSPLQLFHNIQSTNNLISSSSLFRLFKKIDDFITKRSRKENVCLQVHLVFIAVRMKRLMGAEKVGRGLCPCVFAPQQSAAHPHLSAGRATRTSLITPAISTSTIKHRVYKRAVEFSVIVVNHLSAAPSSAPAPGRRLENNRPSNQNHEHVLVLCSHGGVNICKSKLFSWLGCPAAPNRPIKCLSCNKSRAFPSPLMPKLKLNVSKFKEQILFWAHLGALMKKHFI